LVFVFHLNKFGVHLAIKINVWPSLLHLGVHGWSNIIRATNKIAMFEARNLCILQPYQI